MSHPPLTRHAWRAALALVSSMAAACGGDPKPPPIPDPPQVALTVVDGNVAGLSLKLNVTVSGCESVKSLTLFDREAPLKSLSAGAGTTEVELLASEIPYATVGLAANLSLIAEVVCSDDRKNTSMPQPATFFPVARVVPDSQAGQVLATPLAVEGFGTNAAFLSCARATTGVYTLYRRAANGELTAREMPTECNADTVITDVHPTTNKRWVWTPGVTAFALDSTSFNITARSQSTLEVKGLTVMPDGDAVILSAANTLTRLRHGTTDSVGNAQQVWSYTPQQIGALVAGPWVRSGDGRVLLATQVTSFANNRAELYVYELDGATGALRGQHLIRDVLSSGTEVAVPAGAFSDDGSILYLASALANNQGQVVACPSSTDGCTGSSSWTSTVLQAPITRLETYANGTRVAAFGEKRMWALDATTGAMRNKDSRSVDTKGALVVRKVLKGRSNELYLLNGPAVAAGAKPTEPVEIVGVDQSTSGEARELFRYQVAVSMGAGLDNDGRLWLRTGGDLLQALTTSQYRQYRPQ